MNHIFESIPGWFTFPELYKSIVNHYPDNSHFVEIGAWKGRSAAYMAIEIINSGKQIQFDIIDTWQGSEEHLDPTLGTYEPGLLQDSDYIWKEFNNNMQPVIEYIKPIRMPSLEAVNLYEDESLDFAFIDASHDYENVFKDVEAWWPKIKSETGVLAGHDYAWGAEVKAAVDDFFTPLGLQIQEQEGCWIVVKATNNI